MIFPRYEKKFRKKEKKEEKYFSIKEDEEEEKKEEKEEKEIQNEIEFEIETTMVKRRHFEEEFPKKKTRIRNTKFTENCEKDQSFLEEKPEQLPSKILMGSNLIQAFKLVSDKYSKNLSLEVGAFLFGKINKEDITIHLLYIPSQTGFKQNVELDLSSVSYFNDLEFLGWIHSHPNFGCFLSQADVKVQIYLQNNWKHSIAIVYSIQFDKADHNMQKATCGAFRIPNLDYKNINNNNCEIISSEEKWDILKVNENTELNSSFEIVDAYDPDKPSSRKKFKEWVEEATISTMPKVLTDECDNFALDLFIENEFQQLNEQFQVFSLGNVRALLNNRIVLDATKKDFLFVFLEKNHFSLMHVDSKSKSYSIYNSIKKKRANYEKILVYFKEKLLQNKLEVPQQSDSKSCGFYTLLFMEKLLLGKPININEDEVVTMRKKVHDLYYKDCVKNNLSHSKNNWMVQKL